MAHARSDAPLAQWVVKKTFLELENLEDAAQRGFGQGPRRAASCPPPTRSASDCVRGASSGTAMHPLRGGSSAGSADLRCDAGGDALHGAAAAACAAAACAPAAQEAGGGRTPLCSSAMAFRPGEVRRDVAKTAPSAQCGMRTTVMLRNLPCAFTRRSFIRLLDKHGFKGEFDFVYLPIDFARGFSVGYAFVNLLSAELAARFIETFNGFRDWHVKSRKVCVVVWSETQGRAANVDRFQNSAIMGDEVPDMYKPALFCGTKRVPFAHANFSGQKILCALVRQEAVPSKGVDAQMRIMSRLAKY